MINRVEHYPSRVSMINVGWSSKFDNGIIREAYLEEDAQQIVSLFYDVYQGNYPFSFGQDPYVIKAEIADRNRYLWLVAENSKHQIVAAVLFTRDSSQKLGKASGAVVHPNARSMGLASLLLKTGVKYLTEEEKNVDIIYATTRTVNEAPSKMLKEAGFLQLGIFPNGLHIDQFENLNLDIYLTKTCLEKRRKKVQLYPPFSELYNIVKKKLGLEAAHFVTNRPLIQLGERYIKFHVNKDEIFAYNSYKKFYQGNRLAKSFFPFHKPNWIISSEDGGTDIFVWFGGAGMQASILGYRTDQVNIQDLLNSVAVTLQGAGAAYVELLVSAYDVVAQQEAITAKFIPSAYFPAMSLGEDGLRDDYFILSRTFQLLDFSNSTVQLENYNFLQAYFKFYKKLYMNPIIGKKNATNPS